MTRILLADDDATVRELLHGLLGSFGYEVETASDGAEAFGKIASEGSFDLIITDLDMPVMTGLELTKKIREEGLDIPIVILTGNMDARTAVEAMKSGAGDYVLKTEDIHHTIVLSIENVLERKRLRDLNLMLTADLEVKNRQLQGFNRSLEQTVQRLSAIGASLTSERNITRLLEKILSEAVDVSLAEGGTLLIKENDKLEYKIMMNRPLGIMVGGATGESIDMAAVDMESGCVAAYAVKNSSIVNIPDAYKAGDFDFGGIRLMDDTLEYKTVSVLAVPLIDRHNETVGVIQLVNARDPETGKISEFPARTVSIVNSFACQAAVSIENARTYETIRKKNLAFQRFVPTGFLSILGKNEVEDIKLGDASEAALSVLFMDIRSFTSISEGMTPEECFKFLNNYLRHIGPVITENGGFIDKYIGDAIMALFGRNGNMGADEALNAAVGMQNALREYNVHRKKSGYAPIAVGTGINTGRLTLGTIGYEHRMDGTVIGDTVNLAARLESLTKAYGISVAFSEYTLANMKNPGRFLIRELDIVKVKGKDIPVKVYESFEADPEPVRRMKITTLGGYKEALALCEARKYAEAASAFESLKNQSPDDRVIALHAKRCAGLLSGREE